MNKKLNPNATKRLSQVLIEHSDGQDNTVANIVLPLDQVILPKSEEGEEENLTALNWKVVD